MDIFSLITNYASASDLQQKTAEINNRNQYGFTPLMISVKLPNYRVAQWLVTNGADVNAKDKDGYSVLHHVINECDVEYNIIKFLLNHGAIIGPDQRNVILEKALFNNDIELAKSMIANGANVCTSYEIGWTPLMLAVHSLDFALVKTMINLGADVNRRDYSGDNVIAHMLNCDIACSNEVKLILALLIDHGANINNASRFGATPLHYAAETSDPGWTRLMLQYGAKIDASDAYGRTPIAIAMSGECFETVKLLIRRGASTIGLGNIKSLLGAIEIEKQEWLISQVKNKTYDIETLKTLGRK